MNTTFIHKGRLAAAVSMALIAIFCFVPVVQAQSIIYGDSVPTGQTVEGDIILTGTNVVVDGTVAGDLFAVGQNVTINGTIEGSLVAVASKVVINGTIQGTAYIGTVTLVVGPDATLERNLYYSGVSLVTKNGSILGRDLYALAFGSTTGGTITGKTQAVVGPYEVFKLLIEQLKINIQLPETLAPTSQVPGAGGGKVTAKFEQASTSDASTQQFLNGMVDWGMPVVQDLVPLFILGLIAIWLFPDMVSKGAKKIAARPWYTLGIGLLIFVISINITGVVLLLAGLIFLIGLGFGFLSLWGLATIWWALAFFSLALAAVLFFLVVFFGSRIVISYLIGSLILRKTPETSYLRRLGILVLGLVIFVLIASIPMFGWVVSVLAISFGLGGIWQAYRERRANLKWTAEKVAEFEAKDAKPITVPAEVGVKATPVAYTEPKPTTTGKTAAEVPAPTKKPAAPKTKKP
jgi:cytoskeletal protein CcmA (bactofilin family)